MSGLKEEAVFSFLKNYFRAGLAAHYLLQSNQID
jgi:hypothetical protein